MNGYDTLSLCVEVPADEEGLKGLVTQKMPFGTYKGRLLIDLAEPYLVWFSQQGFHHAVTAQVWAKLSMAGAAFFGYAGLLYVGMAVPFVETTDLALLVALASLVWGLLTLRGAKKAYRPKYDLEELVSRITPENRYDFADTDFGEPVGREKL